MNFSLRKKCYTLVGIFNFLSVKAFLVSIQCFQRSYKQKHFIKVKVYIAFMLMEVRITITTLFRSHVCLH